MKVHVCVRDVDTWNQFFKFGLVERAKAANHTVLKYNHSAWPNLTNIPSGTETDLFLFYVDKEDLLDSVTCVLKTFGALWKQQSSVLVFLAYDSTLAECDSLVDVFANASDGSIGKLKIIRNDENRLKGLFASACQTGSLSKMAAGYWWKCPEEPVIWMCNFEKATDINRLKKFKSGCASVSLPFGNVVSMASVRYGLINADLPEKCYVMLLVHLTKDRAKSFAADLVDMEDARIARLAYCLYSGGGCSEDTVNEFCKVLAPNRMNQCQRIAQVLEYADVSDITALCASFLSDANKKTLGPALAANEKKQHLLGEGTVYLTSISILCQGFLLVQCSPGGRLAIPVVDEPSEIGRMRVFAEHYRLPRPIEDHKSEVEAKKYWAIFEDLAKFEERCKIEWELKKTAGYEDLQLLLKQIHDRQDVTNPALVVNAYCAIVRRLGGKI